MTIGAVARAVSVPATTLRYYEREGILAPSNRSPAGYRLYDNEAIERIRFLKAAQSAGFALADIRTLLTDSAGREPVCRTTVQKLVSARLAEVQGRIKDLKRVEELLRRSLSRCRRLKKGCPLLTELNSKTAR
jgi:DNA-binding transcriptional MerR regulator